MTATVRTPLFLCALPIALAALSACAEPGVDPRPDVAEADFVSHGGVTLRAPTDSGLRISFMMFKGVQASTKNMRFVKATVFRGDESFGAFCDLSGSVGATSDEADAPSKGVPEELVRVSCAIVAETVSHDDDESLGFDIVLRRSAGSEAVTLEGMSYFGDGTILGTEAKILGHDDEGPLALTANEASNTDTNALGFARELWNGVTPLLAEQVKSDEVDQPVRVRSVSFRVDSKLDLNVDLALGRTGLLHVDLPTQSLLVTPGDLSKGVADGAGITTKLKAVLPR